MEVNQFNEYQKIKIGEIEFNIVDSIQDFRAEDSFIHRSNKLAQFDGNGEAKKHIGTYKGEKGKLISNFFEYHTWGKEYKDPEKNRKNEIAARYAGTIVSDKRCFFSKKNLLKYLEDAKEEYFAQEQLYHNDISRYYDGRLQEIHDLEDEYIYFTIYDASDNLSQKQNRGYVRSDDKIWNIWRELILPKISYLSILKLLPEDKQLDQTPFYYFRILLDYQFRSFVHPNNLELTVIEEPVVPEIVEELKKLYRIGQERYRKAVIDYMPQCPFSKITDERLLIASHIKPYNVCKKQKRDDQALDHLNGLSLSPTYDRLFDQGYITFSDEGELICGTQLSAYTWEKLNINPNAKNKMRIFPEERGEYLDYHRKHVFQDDIDNFM